MRLPPLDVAVLRARFVGEAAPPSLDVRDEIGSTNDAARRAAERGEADGHVVMAETQSAGRGREGRTWHSPSGSGLWMSILRRVPIPATAAGLVPLAAGVAVCEAVERSHGVRPGLKWPNDVVLDGRKLGGILVESATSGGTLSWIVIGIGVNVTGAGEEFPVALSGQAISLAAAGVAAPDRAALAVATWRAVMTRTAALVSGDGAAVRDAFAARDVLRDRRVHVALGAEESITGVARGIAGDGALCVERAPGEIVGVRTGTVRLTE